MVFFSSVLCLLHHVNRKSNCLFQVGPFYKLFIENIKLMNSPMRAFHLFGGGYALAKVKNIDVRLTSAVKKHLRLKALCVQTIRDYKAITARPRREGTVANRIGLFRESCLTLNVLQDRNTKTDWKMSFVFWLVLKSMFIYATTHRQGVQFSF